MEVAAAVAVQDFHFDGTCTSPYVSAPSSPKRLGGHFDLFRHYTSAPTSPTRASAIYAHFNAVVASGEIPDAAAAAAAAAAGVPFDWEEKPGTPKSCGSPAKDDVFDFAFGFGGHGDKEGSAPVLITADELFEKGMIRPLKPPPRLQYPSTDERSSVASSPRSPKTKGMCSPRHRGRSAGVDEFDPFAAALVEATREARRERTPAPPVPRKASRSLSPLRSLFRRAPSSPPAATAASPATPKSLGCGGSKKWRLRDLLLFRSASEGRKYTLLSSTKKVVAEDVKNSSFRSTDSSGGSMRSSGRQSFSHELHYAATRAAASEELKKKTALPYREGLFGCLRFNPAVLSLSRGFNSHSSGRR